MLTIQYGKTADVYLHGGNGVMILRGKQDDNIPVVYNGVQLQKIVFNGTEISSLIYNGTKLY